ncbi:phosphatidylethanolamine-binding protein [Colletotrichum graminicola]|uniref:Phosphatidylethanolamine-binding protein n=1 Tax=Colletotrichum graminicola (strain M1.001 / M2 / FGSC 10212) TaxID=645133 RepID=E3QZ99_COLGM|nr:phosphatidylethanolamine-binding protein [Colletotrichum graminicola M1.001]EFQ36187.1 phosphatidylethanolamine-binding protein [Colletotrichum graminicola M1.001]WDK22176.1 phosphatidylethanolamine-binding protein [Colletotrichum graminicola]
MSLSDHAQKLTSSLEQAKLVPGAAGALIPEGFEPTTKLEVSFAGKAVDAGNFFRAGECKVAPSVSFAGEAGAPAGACYTLFLTDPDAPTPDNPQFAFWRHWVVPGLQPLSGDGGVVAQGKPALTEFLGPGPKDDSKPHRYLFLLYREPHGLDLKKEDVGGEEFVERRSWKPAEFAEKHGLKLVGVNWMTCAGDCWTK